MQGFDADFAISDLRKFTVPLSSNSAHLCLCLFDVDAVLQPRHNRHEVRVAKCLFSRERQRNKHLRVEPIVRARRQYSDYRVRLTVHPDVFADEITIRVEVLAPKSMTENDYSVPALFAF